MTKRCQLGPSAFWRMAEMIMRWDDGNQTLLYVYWGDAVVVCMCVYLDLRCGEEPWRVPNYAVLTAPGFEPRTQPRQSQVLPPAPRCLSRPPSLSVWTLVRRRRGLEKGAPTCSASYVESDHPALRFDDLRSGTGTVGNGEEQSSPVPSGSNGTTGHCMKRGHKLTHRAFYVK